MCFIVPSVCSNSIMENDLREQEEFFKRGGTPSVEVIHEDSGKTIPKVDSSTEKNAISSVVSPVGMIREHKSAREKRDIVITPVEHGFPHAEVIDVLTGNRSHK